MKRFGMKLRTALLCIAMLAASIPLAQAAEQRSRQDNAASPWVNGQNQSLRVQLEGKVQRLQAELEAKGYEVARGSTTLFSTDDCQYTIDVLGNCLGNNPTSPYIMPVVPLWPDEFVDEGLRGLVGPLPDNTWATHRMDKREALLVVGAMPPPARYFGMQTYIFSRTGTLNLNDAVYQRTGNEPIIRSILFSVVPRSPSRVLIFSSMGNSNNNVTIARQTGAVFNQQRAFVVSTDAAMSREMTDAIVQARAAERSDVLTEPVPSSLAKLGVDAGADDFITLIRYSLPEDEDAGNAWRQQRPIAVLRVRDKNTNATEPWPTPVYDAKTARSELGLTQNLSDLVSAVKQKWGQPGATSGSFFSLQEAFDLVGQHCLPRPMNCLGDTQDADYQASPTAVPDDDMVFAVAGTLGTVTGNALYTSLSLNWLTLLKGVANVSDPDLMGSASEFAGTVPNSGKFYVQYFARNCTGIAHCLTITEDMVPQGDPIKVIQRNYVVRGSARGPDPTQVLNPVAIVLKRSALPASR